MEEKRPPVSGIKSQNRANIYQLLHRSGGLSRQDIGLALQLSRPTVHQNLTELQEEGLIAPAGSIGNTGGRRASSFDIVPEARTAIGLDISRSRIRAVAVDLRGRVICRCRRQIPFARTEAYAQALGDVVSEVIRLGRLKQERILGVGIAVPGLITPEGDRVFYGETMNFTGAALEEFTRCMVFPGILIHDVAAACAAEVYSDPHIHNAFYLMVSDTIGGAVCVNGQSYAGDHARSGEIGHVTVVPGGRQCYCGKRGCLDAYCGTAVLSPEGDLQDFFLRLEAGEETARQDWETYTGHLAVAVNNLRMLFDCSVILGGYLGEQIGERIGDLRSRLAQMNPFEASGDYLQLCACRDECIATGAALHFITEFLHTI